MANSGTGRRSGSGNRRPSGTGNRSANPQRRATPASRPGVIPDEAGAVENGASGAAVSGLAEPPNGQAKGSGTRTAEPVRDRSSADERARERLAQQRAGGARRSGQASQSRPRQGSPGGRPPGAGRGAKSRHPGPQGRKSSTNAAIFGSIFVVLAVVIIVIIATLGGSGPTSAAGQLPTVPAPASLVNSVTKVPASAFAAAGKGSPDVSDQGALVPLPSSAKRTTSGGKPEIVYMGADYCPFCAAFRWPFAIALSRFGTFTGLEQTGSGSHDTDPNTHTLSFYGAKYSSPYISLSTTEFDSNVCTQLVSGGCNSYKALQTPTKANDQLIGTYDVTKYFPAAHAASGASGGWIPFVYWAGKYVESGGFYDPAQLKGFTYADIENALRHPSVPGSAGQSILQAANIYTAVICQIDGGKPGSVCASAPVKTAMASLPKLK
jgi:hypothetical protein